MKIHYRNLGSAKMVTGSCHLITISDLDGEKDLNIIVDMGQVQDGSYSFNQLYQINGRRFPIDFKTVDYVAITHAHSDHLCLLPRLPALDFNGKILCTQLTAELGEINLLDSCKIHNNDIKIENEKRSKQKNGKKKELYIPLYTPASTQTVIDMMQCYSYYQEVKLNKFVSLRLLPSGHIGGASMVLITIKENNYDKNILFSGDTSGFNRKIPFTMLPNLENMKIDWIISENTYGNRIIPKVDTVEELKNHILETCVKNKGKLLISAFSISRSTNILYYLKQVYEKYPELNKFKIYLASPMANKAHRCLGKDSSFEYYDEEWKKHKDLWDWDKVSYVEKFNKIEEIMDSTESCIYVASHGMIENGFSKYIAYKLLPYEKNKILTGGYQGEGNLGRSLLDGIQKSIIVLNENNEKIRVEIKAKTEMLDGLSSHADYNDLIEMFKTTKWTKIKKFIVTHGQEEVCEEFAKKLKDNFNAEVFVPNYGDIIRLY